MQDASTFDLDEYTDTINAFVKRGYQVSSYNDVALNKRHLILRHDIDFSLEAAVHMAELEAAQGWQAYYFILLRTEFYNPLSDAGLASLRKLVALGHQIGLHFDASLYKQADDLPHAASRECAILASIIEKPVDVLSLHRPHPDLLGAGFEVPGRLNAYSTKFFEDIAYCSDSRGAWHHGHPLDHKAFQQGGPMQLLTHPIWWTGKRGSPLDRLEAFHAERVQGLETAIAENCDVWAFREGSKTPNKGTT